MTGKTYSMAARCQARLEWAAGWWCEWLDTVELGGEGAGCRRSDAGGLAKEGGGRGRNARRRRLAGVDYSMHNIYFELYSYCCILLLSDSSLGVV